MTIINKMYEFSIAAHNGYVTPHLPKCVCVCCVSGDVDDNIPGDIVMRGGTAK